MNQPKKHKNLLDKLIETRPKFHGQDQAGIHNWSIWDEILHWINSHLKPGSTTLETGCGYTTVVFAQLAAHHTVVSPFQQEFNLIKAWCTEQHFDLKNVDFVPSLSQDALPGIMAESPQNLDMVLIDGEHAFPAPFIDWFYTAEKIKKGGLVMIDDTHLITGRILIEFLKSESNHWQLLEEIKSTSIFEKIVTTPVVRGFNWTHQAYVRDDPQLDFENTYKSFTEPDNASSRKTGESQIIEKPPWKPLKIKNEQLKSLYDDLIKESATAYENVTQQIYENILNPADTAIDVGANCGRHTVAMARAVGNEGKIFAFEPVKENLKRLRKNIKREDVTNRIIVHPIALANETGEKDFSVFKNSPGLSCFKERPFYDTTNRKVRRVKVGTLDTTIPEDTHIDFIKVDAEGADLDVLRGGIKLINKSRPIIVFETGRINAIPAKLYSYTCESFLDFFNSVGYHLYDTMCLKFDPSLWDYPTLNDLVAIPQEKLENTLDLLWFSVIQVISQPIKPINRL